MQHVLADLTEVDVEITCIVGGRTFLTGVDEGIEQPELNILDVSLFKIVGVKLTHHTTPLRLGLAQRTVGIKVVCQVIGAALLGIVGQVQDGQRGGGAVVGALLTVGIELLHIDLTHIVVRQLIQIALDMGWCERRGTTGEERIDVIPGKEGTVIAARHIGLILRLHKGRRHTRQTPCRRVAHIDIVLGVLEVVDIRGIILDTTGCPCNEMGKLSCEGDVRRFLYMEEGNLVEHRGEPLTLLLPVHVQSP